MRSLFLMVCFFISTHLVSAQDTASYATKQMVIADSSTLNQIDSFYRNLGLSIDSSNNPDLYSEIFEWYRTSYKYGGNSKSGIDCSHFVNMLYYKMYGKKLNSSSSSIYTQCKILKEGFNEAIEGDLVFFKIKRGRISHIAIYLQNGKFAHATTQAGVIISSISEPYYKKHFYRVGRPE